MTVRRALTAIPAVLVAVGLVVFSVVNRQAVDVDFFPLPYQVTLPLFVVLFAGIFIGLAAAGLATLVGRMRRAARTRSAEKRAASLERQMRGLEQDLDRTAGASAAQAIEAAQDVDKDTGRPLAKG